MEAPQRFVCNCARKPLLARVGIYEGAPFLQIKATKAGRVLVDVVVTEGVVLIKCRECLRVHRIKVPSVLQDSHPNGGFGVPGQG